MTKSLSQRVVVTGIGMVTPAGPDRETSWSGLRAGHGLFRHLQPDDLDVPSSHRALFRSLFDLVGAPAAALVAGRTSERVIDLALRAADAAVADARLPFPLPMPERTAVVLGTSKGGFRTFTRAWQAERMVGPTDDGWWDRFEYNGAARALARRFGLLGGALCPVAACATGLVSISRGARMIQEGACDVVLAGSSDASLHPALLASFKRLGVLAPAGETPGEACRPFDRRRNGFIVGEGAAVLVLERASHAAQREALPYAELLAAEMAADPAHLTKLDADPTSLIRLIRETLRRAGVAPEEVDYVGLHGTATRQNDLCETRALHGALGKSARAVACSSLKGTIGHLLGAAGSVESAATLLALRDGIIPPTANLVEPDPECDLDYTPLHESRRELRTALKLSLGFGGHLAAALFRRWSDGPTRAAWHSSPTATSLPGTSAESSSPSSREATR